MRIGIVCPYDLGAVGGVQDQAIKLVGWLRDLGHEPMLVGPGTEGPESATLLGTTSVLAVNRSRAPIRLSLRTRHALREALAGVEVVHIHEPLVPSVSLAATRMHAAPSVGTFHADPSRLMRRMYRGTGMLLRRIMSGLDVATATSPVSRSAVAGIVEARIVPNGIDVSSYSQQPKRPASVAFLGRDEPRKGLDVLLRAWPRIRATCPEATLDVMGAARPDEIPGVVWHGRVDESTKASILARAGIYCAPNLGGESFGIVIAEAMASGCAVVASALPAFIHVAGDAAVFVAPNDPEGIADGIIRLLGDEGLRAGLSRTGVARAAQFDGHRVASDFVAAYEEAIAAS
ncbi:MAG: glycosyltransferase family 4 protein [Acidimicrobiia bacterium]